MDKNGILIKTVLFCVVSILVIVAVAIPLTSEMAEDAKNTLHKNEGGYYTLAGNDDYVEVYIDNTSATVTINGGKYDIYQYGTYLASNVAEFSYVPQGAGYHSIFTINETIRITVDGSTVSKTLKMVFEDGNYTLEYNNGSTTNTYNGTYDYVLHYSGGTGNYLSVNDLPSYKMNGDSTIYLFNNGGGITNTTILKPVKASAGSAAGTSYATGTPPTGNSVTGTWTVTNNDDGTINISGWNIGDETNYTSGCIPVKYYTYGDNAVSSIVSLIPIILILMLLVAVAYVLMSMVRSSGGNDI